MIVESLKGRQLEVIREFSQICEQRSRVLEQQSKQRGQYNFNYGQTALAGG